MFSMHRLPCWKARRWDNTGAVQKHKQVEMRIDYAHSIFNSPIVTTTLIQYFKLEAETEEPTKKLLIWLFVNSNVGTLIITFDFKIRQNSLKPVLYSVDWKCQDKQTTDSFQPRVLIQNYFATEGSNKKRGWSSSTITNWQSAIRNMLEKEFKSGKVKWPGGGSKVIKLIRTLINKSTYPITISCSGLHNFALPCRSPLSLCRKLSKNCFSACLSGWLWLNFSSIFTSCSWTYCSSAALNRCKLPSSPSNPLIQKAEALEIAAAAIHSRNST